MKKTILLSVYAACALMFSSCQEAAKKETPAAANVAEPVKTDLAQVRSEIVALENAWADALNKKDINALMSFYGDDAQSMQDGGPTLMGKAAIQQQSEKDFAAPPTYASIAFETADVYAQGDFATEVGKTMYKDAAGKVIRSGKYMVVYEKRNGKYLCIREIFNKDSK